MTDDDRYTLRARFGDDVVEVEMTPEECFDLLHRGKPIVHAGDGEPIIDEDGHLGERHVTDAARLAQEDDRADI